jgi:hypothetical protein
MLVTAFIPRFRPVFHESAALSRQVCDQLTCYLLLRPLFAGPRSLLLHQSDCSFLPAARGCGESAHNYVATQKTHPKRHADRESACLLHHPLESVKGPSSIFYATRESFCLF